MAARTDPVIYENLWAPEKNRRLFYHLAEFI